MTIDLLGETLDNTLFWQKVSKTDTCWIWTGAVKDKEHPYGRHYIPGRGIVKAHRYSWELAFGPIPAGLHVLHKCDNPACVNPDHLFVGSHRENMRDMAAKGRAIRPAGEAWRKAHPAGSMKGPNTPNPLRGSAHPNAVLNETIVAAIKRDLQAAGNAWGAAAAAARRHGVNVDLVRRIKRGVLWAHVEPG